MTPVTHPIAPAPAPLRRIRLPWLFPGTEPTPPAHTGPPALHFVEVSAVDRLLIQLVRKFGMGTLVSPVALFGKQGTITPLTVIGQAMGFGDETSQRLLHAHHRQRLRRRTISTLLHTLLQLPLAWFILFPFLDLIPDAEVGFWSGSMLLGIVVAAGMWAAACAMMFLGVGIIVRLGGVLIDRHFAESLCATHAMYLLVELQREDVLSRADRRRELVSQFDELARTTQLLALRYGSADPEMRARVQRHFREMASYIAERRVWAVTPLASTLEDLQRDVRELTRIFITGQYGELHWTNAAAAQAEAPGGGWRSLARGTGRIAGSLAVLGVMGYLLRHPQTLGGSTQVVALIFVAWLLISLDSVLKLGVVSGVVNLAKSIKELK